MDVVADYEGERRVKARLVLVCVDLETIRIRPIPDRIRARMRAFELNPGV